MYQLLSANKGKLVAVLILVCLLAGFTAVLSCSFPQDTGANDSDREDKAATGDRSLVSPNDFTTTQYAPDNKGYLKTNPTGKKFMHLEGTGYAMGYEHGYLLASNIQRMTSSDFVIAVLSNFLGLSPQDFRAKVGKTTVSLIITSLQTAARSFESNIPAEYRDELSGIVNGASARGYSISYDNLLVNNLAFDVLLGIAYPIVAPILGLNALFVPHMCDGFIVNGNGTSDGRTLMGRNFMFTDAFIHEEMLLVEYCPSSGNKFVTPTIPAWVGLVSGMNESGIGIGVDMAPAIMSDVTNVGMGVVIASRRALQYSNNLSQGVSSIRSAGLGISWIVSIGSGINEIGGAVIETCATRNKVRYLNYKYPAIYNLIPGLPRQIENKSDLVVFANHFIVPDMVILAGNPAIPDSTWRYQTLTNLILNSYGSIDTAKGKQLVDYLHPPAYGYYGTDTTTSVKGSRCLYDLKNLEIWSLYGHYDDQWMDYKF